jgi:hypothetical protein
MTDVHVYLTMLPEADRMRCRDFIRTEFPAAQEPLPADHPFWTMENVILSPHIGAFNADYIAQVLPFLKENMTL